MKILQKKLQSYYNWVEDIELPSPSKKGFGKMSEKCDPEKSKILVQNFLDLILSCEVLGESEAAYRFFTSNWDNSSIETSEDVKKSRETKFTKIKEMFTNSDCKKNKDSLEEMIIMEDLQGKPSQLPDDLAEPLYALISEIYELKGVFKWFRRSLITIAYISFGGTISRKLVDTVHWLLGDSMFLSYLTFLKDIISQTEDTRPPSPLLEEKEEVREEARELFVSEGPDIMVKVVGLQTARQGAAKIFDSFQDQKLNKHLFYDLLEHFLVIFIPELRKTST